MSHVTRHKAPEAAGNVGGWAPLPPGALLPLSHDYLPGQRPPPPPPRHAHTHAHNAYTHACTHSMHIAHPLRPACPACLGPPASHPPTRPPPTPPPPLPCSPFAPPPSTYTLLHTPHVLSAPGTTVLGNYGLANVDMWAYTGYLSLFFLVYFSFALITMTFKRYSSR